MHNMPVVSECKLNKKVDIVGEPFNTCPEIPLSVSFLTSLLPYFLTSFLPSFPPFFPSSSCRGFFLIGIIMFF